MLNEFKKKEQIDEIKQQRVLRKYIKGNDFPTLVITVCMHGNEPAALAAMKLLFSSDRILEGDLRGNIYVLIGNVEALNRSQRFVHKDFNRVWSRENLDLVRHAPKEEWPEIHELHELKSMDHLITSIVAKHGVLPLVFLDLHTTSADSAPFIPFNDAIMNRKLAENFPIPLILGIEEFLDGPLMSYVNDLGFPALGFEAGRHDDPFSADRHAAFVELFLYHLGMIYLTENQIHELKNTLILGFKFSAGFYEIIYRHGVFPFSGFKMAPGFRNFQEVERNQILASDQSGEISAVQSGLIFMPLYQTEGDDGFFIIRPVSGFWLWISTQLRRLNLLRWIAYLPGVRVDTLNPRIFWANPKITRFFPREIFHLLGFRVKRTSSDRLMLVFRE
ncbi:succinylglutamate desuccinylase/aspartoacylase family protein [Lunatibacter salilacus]|uniref:succinylglutamate desuccinylase/aspartoacylase family protein n=1 Tax=Lunatibacter salilacus TaxID=2483804 RepID=UPI00131B2BDC|nr:succinylglutamate desuccinylase/aspartoacylase family protein [Lunatibacter salilacus]